VSTKRQRSSRKIKRLTAEQTLAQSRRPPRKFKAGRYLFGTTSGKIEAEENTVAHRSHGQRKGRWEFGELT